MMFSASQVILAIVFVCAGVVLTRAMGRFPTSEGGAMEMVWKKINLWLLIGSYMITAVMGFSFDVAHYTRECHDASWGVYRAGGCTADVQGVPSSTTVVPGVPRPSHLPTCPLAVC